MTEPPRFRPLAGNPLRTRTDLQRAVRALVAPLVPCFSPGRARVKLGHSGALFSGRAEELEGFARPLWGLVPLAAGGGDFAHWELFREGLRHGSDPDHPEFWGWAETDQRQVEMAAIGFALAMVPELVWDPLSGTERKQLAAWLGRIDAFDPLPSNWQLFRVLVHLGLERVGEGGDTGKREASFRLLDSYYVGDGWYRDGDVPQLDYYVAFAFHFYGLVYAALAGPRDPARAERYREQAARFAQDFQHWFDPRGGAVPFGRSMTYRFAQGALWGAFAFAGVEALPWGRMKGLYLRHLRWWAERPIARSDGILSLGYGYENLLASEEYSSAGSPYWALKFFLPLALPEDHAFWRAEEEPLPAQRAPSVQVPPGMLLSRDASQAVALASGQSCPRHRQGAAKYAKLAYSSVFGFSVESDCRALHQGAYDSMLALCEPGGRYRVREACQETRFEGALLYSRWKPWPDVTVETVLVAATPWHLRLHRLRTTRTLESAEGGFAIPWPGYEPELREVARAFVREPGVAWAPLEGAAAGIRDLRAPGRGGDAVPPEPPAVEEGATPRQGELVFAAPNTNLIEPRTVIPTLRGTHAPGEHLLACAVFATDRVADAAAEWEAPPAVPEGAWRLLSRSRFG